MADSVYEVAYNAASDATTVGTLSRVSGLDLETFSRSYSERLK